jgi:hypothetical protein
MARWKLWNYEISGYHGDELWSVNMSYVVGHKRSSGLLFYCIVFILWELIIFWCGYVNSCGNDRKPNNKKTAIPMHRPRDGAFSGQRLGKHVPAAKYTNAKIEDLCFLCGPYPNIISKEEVYTRSVVYGSLWRQNLSGRLGARYQKTSNNRLRILDSVL